MAIIQTIRDKYAKLAGFVIILALLGFVLMDFGRSSFSSSTTAAKIEGENIDVNELFRKVNGQRNIVSLQTNQEITEEAGEQISEQVFENYVADILLDDIYADLGVGVSEEEINDMFAGAQPDYLAQQVYARIRPDQPYDPNGAMELLNSLRNSSDPNEHQFWLSLQDALVNTRKQTKVNTLVAASFYAPQVILDAQHELNTKSAQLEFVQLPYNFVSDDKVTITDEEIDAYINDNKYMFTNKVNSRDLELVTIPIVPSAADSAVFFAEMDSLKSQFSTAAAPEEFASLNSSRPFQAQYFSETQLSSLPNANDLTAAGVNTITGPFPFESDYALAKVMDKVTVADTVEVKEIVVVAQMGNNQVMRSKEDAKARIDSAAAEITAGRSIDSVGLRFGDNTIQNPSAVSMTYYGEQYGMMPEAMREFVFTGASGTSKLIEIDENGTIMYYYMQIVRRSSGSQSLNKILFLTRAFLPGSETRTDLEIKANTFASSIAQGTKTFDQLALEMGLQKRPVNGFNPNSKLIPGIGTSVDLAKWANGAELGAISPVTIINNNYVIARLTGINKAGELNKTEAAINYAREEIKKKKKAEILKAEYDSIGDLSAIAAAISGTPVTVESFTAANPNNASLASEPKLTGYILSAAGNGQLSKGIPGNGGVYYVKVNSVQSLPAPQRNIFNERRSAMNMYRQNSYRLLLNSKMEKADIRDNRNKFLN